jgi:hypothetical protein
VNSKPVLARPNGLLLVLQGARHEKHPVARHCYKSGMTPAHDRDGRRLPKDTEIPKPPKL